MSNVAIRVHHVSKRYQIGSSKEDTLRGQVSTSFQRFLNRLPKQRTDNNTIWALNDVSFELRQGEVLGVIGANGSGKSTLLKILSNITRPTSGWVGINGRISSLLGVGTGFSPDLTGRENIYLNGAVLGLKQAEILRKFDEIVGFSEIGQLLDTPVKHYSSGMHVRLAFSVAMHLNTDIMLVDEVLAVGDAAFRQKSMARMQDMVKNQGRTIIFVSHDSSAITKLCTKCIYLDKGRLRAEGDPNTILGKYLGRPPLQDPLAQGETHTRSGNGTVRLTVLRFLDATTLQPLSIITAGQDVVIEAQYKAQDAAAHTLHKLHLALAFFNASGQFVTVANSLIASDSLQKLPASGKLYCWIPRFPLMEGEFRIVANLVVNGKPADSVVDAAIIVVEPADYFQCGHSLSNGRQGVYMQHYWTAEAEISKHG